jgi:hypothetical protein
MTITLNMENKLSEQDWQLLFFENEFCHSIWYKCLEEAAVEGRNWLEGSSGDIQSGIEIWKENKLVHKE